MRHPFGRRSTSQTGRRESRDPVLRTPAMGWRAPSALALLSAGWLLTSQATVETSAADGIWWNGIFVGVAVGALATVRLSSTRVSPALSLVNVAIGAWLIMSPLIYGYALWAGSRLAWSDLIAGIFIAAFALASFAGAVGDS